MASEVHQELGKQSTISIGCIDRPELGKRCQESTLRSPAIRGDQVSPG